MKAFIILGLPGEDMSTIKQTRRFLDVLMSNRFTNKFGKEITNDFDITVYFPYKGTRVRDYMDKKDNHYDIFFTKDPDEMLGFYKGNVGSAKITVRTSGLSVEDIGKIQKNLLEEYKTKS